jgi:hypothetical protein
MKNILSRPIKRVLTGVLNGSIGIYVILIPLIIITGGFTLDWGIVKIKATTLRNPLIILPCLVVLRLMVSMERNNLFLFLLSLAVSLGMAELALRLINPPIAWRLTPIHQPSPVLAWELIPSAFGVGSVGEKIRINAAGYRDDAAHPKDKPDQRMRIICVGDSFTFGMGVDLQDTFAKKLEAKLNRAGKRCEVLNFGVIAYQMWNHVEVIKRKALSYHPDLIVLALFFDDLAVSLPPRDANGRCQGYDLDQSIHYQPTTSVALNNFIKNISAYYENKYRYKRGHDFLKSIEGRKKLWGPSHPESIHYQILAGTAERHVYQEFSQALATIGNLTKDHHIEIVVVLIPDAVQVNDPHRQAVNAVVRGECVNLGLPFLDITPIFEKQNDLMSLYLFPLDGHTSAKGHQLIAEALSQHILGLNAGAAGP